MRLKYGEEKLASTVNMRFLRLGFWLRFDLKPVMVTVKVGKVSDT